MKVNTFLKYFSPLETKTSLPIKVPTKPTKIINPTRNIYSSKAKPIKKNANDLNMLLISSEAANAHKNLVLEKHKLFNEQTLMRILSGAFTSTQEYKKLLRYRIQFIHEFLYKAFEEVDFLITPVWPCYIPTIKESDLIFIENLPNFNEGNSNQQQRFITFIDIIYEKKIPLMIKSEVDLNSLCSASSLKVPFKRTVSRLYEMTTQKLN